MKKWKQLVFFGFLAILVFAFVACDNGNGNNNVAPKLNLPNFE
jgi:hypothetical protein